jgi:hypothetical protein
LESLAQRRSGHVRHGIVGQTVDVARREQRHDVRMLKLRGKPDLALEAIGGNARAELRR